MRGIEPDEFAGGRHDEVMPPRVAERLNDRLGEGELLAQRLAVFGRLGTGGEHRHAVLGAEGERPQEQVDAGRSDVPGLEGYHVVRQSRTAGDELLERLAPVGAVVQQGAVIVPPASR